MKKSVVTLAIVFFLASFSAFSQQVYIGGVNVSISSDLLTVTLHEMDLALEDYDGIAGNIHSKGIINLTNNLNISTSTNPFYDYFGESGLLAFHGNNNSHINSISDVDLQNLSINKSSGGALYLNAPVNLSGKLFLNSGIIHSDNINVLTLEKNASVSGGDGSHNSHVKGSMQKVADIDDNEFLFPLGTGFKYRPIGFYNLDGPTTFNAKHVENDPAAGWDISPESEGNVVDGKHLHRISNVEYWLLESSNNVDANVVLSWDDDYSQVDDCEFLIAAVWNGSAWKNLGANSLDIEKKQFDSYISPGLFGEFRLASHQSVIMGDVNNDGVLNVLDVVWMVDYINGNPPDGFNVETADLNNDDVINVADLTLLISVILGIDKYNDEDIESEIADLYLHKDGTVGLESDGTLTALHFQLSGHLSHQLKAETLLDSDHILSFNEEKGIGLIYSMSNSVFNKGYVDLFKISGVDTYDLKWVMAEASNIGYKLVEVATNSFSNEPLIQDVITSEWDFNIYPNPTKGLVYIKFKLDYDAIMEFEIIDQTGRIVYKKSPALFNQGTNTVEIRSLLTENRSGLYMLRVFESQKSSYNTRIKHEEKILMIK